MLFVNPNIVKQVVGRYLSLKQPCLIGLNTYNQCIITQNVFKGN